jgi:hypothetical protein
MLAFMGVKPQSKPVPAQFSLWLSDRSWLSDSGRKKQQINPQDEVAAEAFSASS